MTYQVINIPADDIPPAWGLGRPVNWDPFQNATAAQFGAQYGAPAYNPSPDFAPPSWFKNTLSGISATGLPGTITGQPPTTPTAASSGGVEPGSWQDWIYRGVLIGIGLLAIGAGLFMFKGPAVEVISGRR